ncbi:MULTISPECIES: PAS domain-containing protein [Haloferacaceae]|uniref:histidine kinase n=1 Tax=Halorubrum glutamatedens TaxID=2707018 RepID=A0ABD5QT50_9EURY|nr:PAS domain-containing protein [Halobellus captivus]
MTAEGRPLHVGSVPNASWSVLPEGTRTVSRVPEADAGDDVVVVLLRLDGDPTESDDDRPDERHRDGREERTERGERTDRGERLRRVSDRFPETPILAYTADDDVDAAIDVGRRGIEYVSGRRLAADEETLAERAVRLTEAAEKNEGTNDEFLERFLRITADRSLEVEAKIDRLLELGRDRLDLTIGFTSRIDDDEFELTRQLGADDLLRSLVEAGAVGPDGTVPLETTYCRRTIEDGGVTAFSKADADGWAGDPAHEVFGLETYIGGRVVVDNEVLGTLCFADEETRDRAFTPDERLFVELLAEWLGQEFERQRARDRLQSARKRLENTLERIDDAFFALDDDWEFTYVNAKAAMLLERDADDLVGTNVWSEFPDALEEAYESAYREAMETQQPVVFEQHYEPLDLWTKARAYPSEEGLSVFFTDVTDRKRREQRLERLLGTTEGLQRASDVEGIAERLVDAAEDVLGYEINGVRLYDPGIDALEVVALSDGAADRLGVRPPRDPGDGVVGEAFATGEPVITPDVSSRDDGREYGGVRSVIAVPLGEHGVFSVASAEPDAFDESDVSIVKLLATNGAAAFERVERQRRLRTYELALENVDDMVCVLDVDGRVTYATEPFAAWLGVDRESLVDRPLSARLPDASADAVAEALASVVSGADERTASVDLWIERDGERVEGGREEATRRRGELRLSGLGDDSAGVVGSLADTTDLYRARSELSQERDRFDRLFERLPDPAIEVIHRGDDTIVRAINPAFAERFGYDESAIRGEPVTTLDLRYDPLDESAIRGEPSLDRRVREEGFVTDEVRRRTVDGPREFLFRGFTYETPEGTHAFGIYTDITERKHRERYLTIVNRILRHNLRNELNVVFGFASEIQGMTGDDRVRDYAARIEATAERLVALGDGAREIKEIVDEGVESDPEPVSVAPVARTVADRWRDDRPEARIDVAVPPSIAVRADDRFERVLDHLVENAIVHAGSGSPRVSIAAEPDPDGAGVTVTVSDDGPGIPEAIREVVAGDTEVTQLRHNSGLGLWIVAWVVESYGGTVRFGPGIDGAGTAVHLRLPAADGAE